MAHYAQINDNIVQQVLVMDNAWTDTECQNWLTANVSSDVWIQTSYNNNIRKQFAGIGMTYDAVKDKFINPQPYASWALDSDDDWQPPTARPNDDKLYGWDEDSLAWIEVE
tara:strand:+ start:667 stop:999 length:333 start_codon:yes stop_codon:yes gene_type:complete